jgi:hypothetical protein
MPEAKSATKSEARPHEAPRTASPEDLRERARALRERRDLLEGYL